MKQRLGFVSNSSSSSYLVPTSAVENVFTLAQYMIETRDRERAEDAVARGESPIPWHTLQTLIQSWESGTDPETPVQFYSGNYATYILKTPKGYLIETCNNVAFSLSHKYHAVWADDHTEFAELPEYHNQPCSAGMFDERYLFLEINKYGRLKSLYSSSPTPCGRFVKISWSCGAIRPDTHKLCYNRLLILDDGTEFCSLCEMGIPLE